MARFDVFPHPDAAMRSVTPFLLDVQNDYINQLQSRVVIPLRLASAFGPTMRDLNPVFTISRLNVVLDTAGMAAFPVGGLKKAVTNLSAQNQVILSALDTLFGSY